MSLVALGAQRFDTTRRSDVALVGVVDRERSAEAALRPISAPTLVIWGERDQYLGSELAEPDLKYTQQQGE